MSERSVGWAGLGRMGQAMCRRLVDAGVKVAVWNRTPEKAPELVEAGATLVERPVDLAGCDVVFAMLADGAALDAVLSGEGGLLTGPTVPAVLIDSSTISKEDSERCRDIAEAAGTEFLAAPVSGNPKMVAAGGMIFVVSGPKSAFDSSRDFLEKIGQAIHVGDGDVSRLVKIAHNLYLGVVIQALAEVTILCESLGVKRSDFLDFLNRSAMGSTFSRYKTPALVNLDFTPTFTTVLLQKDLELGLDAAKDAGVTLPTVALAHQLVKGLVGMGYGESDFAALILQQASLSGMSIESENVEIDDGLVS